MSDDRLAQAAAEASTRFSGGPPLTDLHQPRSTVTQSASGHLVDTPGPCTACDRDWPCPTITAINEALGEE